MFRESSPWRPQSLCGGYGEPWVLVCALASVRGCRLRLHPGLRSGSLAAHPAMLRIWDSDTRFNKSEHTAAGEGAVRQSRRGGRLSGGKSWESEGAKVSGGRGARRAFRQREALPRRQRRGTEVRVLCNAPGPADGSPGGGNRSISFMTPPPSLPPGCSEHTGGRSALARPRLLVEYIARTTNN